MDESARLIEDALQGVSIIACPECEGLGEGLLGECDRCDGAGFVVINELELGDEATA